MKKINLAGFDAIDFGPTNKSCGMHEVVIPNSSKFRTVLGNIPDVYIDPRKAPNKHKLFLIMGTREQYIELTGGMEESPWFQTRSGYLRKYFTCKK